MPRKACSVIGAACAVLLLFAANASAEEGGGAIEVARVAPYQDVSHIADKIVDECPELGEKLGRFVNQYATKYDIVTERVDAVDPKAGGRVLVVEITDAVSAGRE